MSRRITITLRDRDFIQIAAICRIEHRKPAELARVLMLSAMEHGLRPRQPELFDALQGPKGKPLLRVIRGGKGQA